ncbi:MAG TPA: type IV pilus modification protein PilV [Steroidobacteraceae bacterium]|nr:type IV pilus modification protein PilV [Steroidobacteraceae bacterium]
MSLIEVLVALVVMSVGMMGVASLMLQSLRNGHGALMHTQAVNLVSDMEERIRANPAAGGAYDCAVYPGGAQQRDCAPAGVAPVGGNCSADELAEDDLARWQRSVRLTLPAVSPDSCAANVSYAAAGTPGEAASYRVSVAWQPAGEPAPLVYESDLVLASPPGAP